MAEGEKEKGGWTWRKPTHFPSHSDTSRPTSPLLLSCKLSIFGVSAVNPGKLLHDLQKSHWFFKSTSQVSAKPVTSLSDRLLCNGPGIPPCWLPGAHENVLVFLLVWTYICHYLDTVAQWEMKELHTKEEKDGLVVSSSWYRRKEQTWHSHRRGQQELHMMQDLANRSLLWYLEAEQFWMRCETHSATALTVHWTWCYSWVWDAWKRNLLHLRPKIPVSAGGTGRQNEHLTCEYVIAPDKKFDFTLHLSSSACLHVHVFLQQQDPVLQSVIATRKGYSLKKTRRHSLPTITLL